MQFNSETKVRDTRIIDGLDSCRSLPQFFPAMVEATRMLRAASSGDSTEVETGANNRTRESCDSTGIAKVPGLLPASTRDTSPYSNASSAVKPRLIPFGDGSSAHTQRSTSSKKPIKETGKLYEKLLSDDESEGRNDLGDTEVPTTGEKTKGKTPARPTQLVTKLSDEYPKKEVPSVVEEVHDAVNVSAISWTGEDAVKVGHNSYLARHADPNNVIIYRVISKEDAEKLIESRTYDTEAPILSHSLSSGLEIDSGTSIRQFPESRITWKLRATLCVAGVMILAAGCFVGIAVALLGVESASTDSSSTAWNETEAYGPYGPMPSAIPNMAPTSKITTTVMPTTMTESTPPTAMSSSMKTHTPAPTEIAPGTTLAPTFNPSALPPVSLYDTLPLPPHTWEAMANSSSHHSKSFKFVQQDPNLPYYSQHRRLQRFVLSVLYHSTEGENWLRDDSWLSMDIHECDWSSIDCGVDEAVVNITLADNNLGGSLPLELALLTTMSHLDLSHNKLRNTIPAHMGDLVKLETLRLDNNTFSGPLPHAFGNLTQIHNLNLTSNFLTGSIPAGWRALSGLSWLGLGENHLTGNITADIGQWKNLTELCLHKNRLGGPIPTHIGELTKLQKLMFYENRLMGSLPSEIALLQELTDLELDSNSIEENIPTEIGLLTNLEQIWLSSNAITGPIPSELGGLSSLKGLYMQVNKLAGLLPSELGLLSNMKEMRLFENQLRGALPTELGNLAALEQLSLGWNAFSGFIFTDIGRLRELRELDLVANNLDGTIVTTIGNLTNLKHLWLFSNNLEQSIPSELGKLSMLDQMLLFWNWLTGSIPSELGHASAMSVLSLESNQLAKSIPSQLGLLSNLNWLMLYDNQLSGELPSQIGMLGNLTWLRLEKNRAVSGTIPRELGGLESLEHATFHGTSLSGTIPGEFCVQIATNQLLVGIECNEISCDCGCMCYNSFL